MGVDPERIFDIVHEANMGKVFLMESSILDPVTHKILKPDDWEEKMLRTCHPTELQRQFAKLMSDIRRKNKK